MFFAFAGRFAPGVFSAFICGAFLGALVAFGGASVGAFGALFGLAAFRGATVVSIGVEKCPAYRNYLRLNHFH